MEYIPDSPPGPRKEDAPFACRSVSQFSIGRSMSQNSVSSQPQVCPRNESMMSVGSSLSQPQAPAPPAWQQDTSSCSLCNSPIGKFLRHHCRICGLCVCASCSPSAVRIEGIPEKQRVCTACVTNAVRVPATVQRLEMLSGNMYTLSNDRRYRERSTDLSDATSRCEAAIVSVEVALVEARRRGERAEEEIAAIRDLVRELLAGVRNGLPQPEVDPTAASIEATLVAINAELKGSTGRRKSIGRTTSKSSPSMRAMPSPRLSHSPRCGPRSSSSAANNISSVLSATSGKGGELSSVLTQGSNNWSASGKWEENTASCSICNLKFGWMHMKRRHHCRSCGLCVCSACSPNFIQMEASGPKPVRVCTPCIADVPSMPFLVRRTTELSLRLSALVSRTGSTMDRASLAVGEFGTELEQAIGRSETALDALEKLNSSIRNEQEAQMQFVTGLSDLESL